MLWHRCKKWSNIINNAVRHTFGWLIFRRFRKIAKSDYELYHVCPSVRMKQLVPHCTDFNEICSLSIFRKCVEEIRVSLTSVKNNGFFTWRPIYVFLIISRSFILRIRNVSDKRCRENQNTHFVFSNFFFIRKMCCLSIMWKNSVQRGRPQIKIWSMRIACWIPKATNTHTQVV